MIRLLFNIVVWLRLPDISKRWKLKDCTWDIDTCDCNEGFPWHWSPPTTTTYANNKQGFHQQYGRFRAKFQMKKGWCFWLLNLEHGEYLEIDHFEIFDEKLALSSWRNKHFNSQRRIPNRDFINPEYEGHIPFKRDIYSRIYFRGEKVREYILAKPRRYEIVWRRWFVLWKVDGWPCGVMFRHIPRQPMFLVVTGPKMEDIEELQVKN